MTKPLLYIAGCFSNSDSLSEEEQSKNRKKFQQAQWASWYMGWCPINPIELDSWAWSKLSKKDRVKFYDMVLGCDLAMIGAIGKSGGAIYFMPGWEQSGGAKTEWDFATSRGIKILYTLISPDSVFS